jgi:hypothetical protein
MKITALLFLNLVSCQDKHYNILSLDGGGIRGLIPAQVLKYMEQYAYEYSTSKGYTFPKYPGRDGIIPMKDLFDMMAGTSTGSIISAALSYPSDEKLETGEQVPQFWSKEVIEVYSQRGDEIFQKKSGNKAWVNVLIFFLFVSLVGGFFYLLGKLFYDNDEVMSQFMPLEGMLAFKKKMKKNDGDDIQNQEKFEKKYKMKVHFLKQFVADYKIDSFDENTRNGLSAVEDVRAMQVSRS